MTLATFILGLALCLLLPLRLSWAGALASGSAAACVALVEMFALAGAHQMRQACVVMGGGCW